MRYSFILNLLIIMFIFTVTTFVFIWGMNRVSQNMNNIYSSGSGNALLLESENSHSRGPVEEEIPLFLAFEHPEAYTYRLFIMGRGIQTDFKNVINCFNAVKENTESFFDI